MSDIACCKGCGRLFGSHSDEARAPGWLCQECRAKSRETLPERARVATPVRV